MKRKFIFLTMLLLTLLGGVKFNVLNAQETVIIGENSQCTGFNLLPNNCYYNYSITQQIYTSDELGGAPGTISSIAFRSSASYNFSRTFKVYMLNTSKNTFDSNTDMVNVSDADLVYEGSVTYVNSGTWMVLELSTPFNYTGENLILCVCDNTGSYKDQYNHFYVYDSGENRSLYKFTDNAAFDPKDIHGKNQQAASYQVGMDKRVNQLQIVITSASASIKVSKESIALGNVRLGNYWTEKPVSETVEVKAAATTITSISCDNDFFTLDYDLSKKPVSLVVSYNKNASESGEQSGNITITSADCDPVVIPVTATAYTPAEGDVWELAKEISLENRYTDNVTGMYDDYILPGEAEDGNAGDAVYKFTLENEGVITASVTGTNGNVAIYKADSISSKRGPSSKNNYNGISIDIENGSTAPTTFGPYTFDTSEDMNYFTYDPSYWYYTSYSYRIYTYTADEWIFTNQIYAINKDSRLYFDYCTYNGLDKVIVGVMDCDGKITEIGNGYTSTSNGYTEESGPVSLNVEGEYYIGFKLVNANNYLYIDNIKLSDNSRKSRTRGAQIDGVQYPAGTYYLVAAAEGDFTLNLSTSSLPAPAEFAYTTPENNKIAEQTNPELKWGSAKYATNYDVYLGTTADALSIVAEDITATSFQTTGLSNNTKYYWQVVAKNSIGEREGATWSFVTPLDIPQNVTASSNEIYPENNTVTISWDKINAAKGYNVYIKRNGQGEGIAHNHNTLITETSYQIDNMDYSSNGHIIYVTAVYEIDGEEYESEASETETVKVTDYITVSGKVTDGTNVIAGATVVATGTDEFGKTQNYGPVTTNNDGDYTFNVLVGEYTFTASKFDYKDKTTETLVLDYLPFTLNITLESNPVVEFEVNAEENGDNANVSWTADYTSYNVYRRDSEGNVTKLTRETIAAEQYSDNWSSLPNGEYQYGVSAMVVETSYVTETFSTTSIPEGWTQNGTYSWYFNGAQAYLYQGYTDASPNNLITPLIDLSNETAPFISFKYSIAGTWVSSGYYNTLKVEVSESLNGPWTNIFKSSSYTNGFVAVQKSLSEFAGKKVYVKFVTDTDYSTTYIDDVVLPNSTTSESKVNWSAPVEKGGIAFTGNGNWNDEANWNRVPSTTDKVVIKGNATITENVTVGSINIASGATLTVKSGAVLNVTNGISNKNAAALVMEDGAQIHQPNANVAATFNMKIVNPTKGWGEGSNNKDGWQFISSPLMNASTSAFATSGDNNDFDLYKYDGTKDLEWINYKDHQLEGDTFFYNFSDGMQGWTTINANNDSYKWGHTEDGTGKNFDYGAPNGYNGEKGCLFSDAVWYNSTWQPQYINPNDYVVSPERVMIVKDSKLSFYIQSATNNYKTGEITVLVSESGTASADSFEQIYSVNDALFKNEWFKITISLAEYAGKEVWIAIRHNVTNALNSYILIDNLELTNGKTRSGNKDLFETEFVNGRGYLASYQAATTAKFVGTLNNATAHEYEVSYAGTEKDLANFHLFGNLFTFNMDWSKVQAEGLVEGYAVVNGDGGYDYLTTGTINVGDGFFVKAIAEDPSLYYNHNARGSRQDVNSINVIATGKAGQDNVVINFAGQKEGFDKLQNFNDEIATVFVANNGRRYGIANVEENVAEVELSFVASQMGNYSISLDVNGEFETVTLVDRFTGIETNMLIEDEYNFTATSRDNANRFVVKLDNRQQTTDNSQFVYQSGEELILSIEGTVQIVDMLGRVVYSNEHSNGSNRINVSEFNNAAYVVRVVNEEGVKSQKVVIY